MKRTGILLLLILLMMGLIPVHAAKVVAAIFSSDAPRYRSAHRSMVRSLSQHGFAAPTVEVFVQTPNADPISWANSLRKAQALDADVVVTYGAPVSLSAVQEKIARPLVFVDVYGPVEIGLAKSMTTMEAHICGVSSKVPLMTLMKSAVAVKPIKSLAVLYSSREVGSLLQLKELKRIAASLGFAVVDLNVSSSAQLDHALGGVLSDVDALFVTESSVGGRSFEKIVSRSASSGIPVLSTMPEAAEKGALLALEISPDEQGQLAADFVVKILSGKKVVSPAIVSPRDIDLVVNLKAARQLELTVPFQVLSTATKAIK